MKWIGFSEHFKFTFVEVKTERQSPKNVSKLSEPWKGIVPRKILEEKKEKSQLKLVTTDQSKMRKYYYLHVGMSSQERSTRGLKQVGILGSSGRGTPSNGLRCCCCLKLICGLAGRAKARRELKGQPNNNSYSELDFQSQLWWWKAERFNLWIA